MKTLIAPCLLVALYASLLLATLRAAEEGVVEGKVVKTLLVAESPKESDDKERLEFNLYPDSIVVKTGNEERQYPILRDAKLIKDGEQVPWFFVQSGNTVKLTIKDGKASKIVVMK